MFWLTVWVDTVHHHCGKGMDVWVSVRLFAHSWVDRGEMCAGIQLPFSFFLFHAVQGSSLWMVLPNFRMSLPTPVNPVSKCPHKHTQKCASLRPQVFSNLSKLSKSADQGPFFPPQIMDDWVVSFLHCYDKVFIRNNLKDERFIGAHGLEGFYFSPSWERRMISHSDRQDLGQI